MFNFFQTDIPIGRRIWLVALTLIATNLLFGAPINLVGDPAAVALSMIIYTAHSVVYGWLYSFLPCVVIRFVDLFLLLRRSLAGGKPAILFDDYKYDRLVDAVASLCIVFAAVTDAPRFGALSFDAAGLYGIGCLVMVEVFNIDMTTRSSKKPALLEIKTVRSRPVARLFLSGKLFAAMRLDEDLGSAIAHLRSAGWEFDSNAGISLDKSAWLQKDVSEERIRLMAAAAEGRITRAEVIREIRYVARIVALTAMVLGWIAGAIGIGYIDYLAHHYRPHSLSSVILPWARGLSAGMLAVLGTMLFVVALPVLRWLEGRSLLTGRPKKGHQAKHRAVAPVGDRLTPTREEDRMHVQVEPPKTE